ncbi:MAG: putative toxin-antitoxin system toxin component, PIN family, partial [Oceanipulchritudo sp.]
MKTCRDPKDDKFLEVAFNGRRADALISGDSDLSL